MQTYLVGGAIRDALLGEPEGDRDWVVVGATPQEMTALGYLPVGRDFPVFLHPRTREEYALARTERKSGPGYRGFVVHASPEVTLEEDLARRDLTINAMALPQTQADLLSATPGIERYVADLVDPFDGRRDLAAKVLRHVTDAFREDPVRILRLARFAARFTDFRVAPETMALMREMVIAGEVDALVAERVWQELSRGLMEAMPSRMFDVLEEAGALQRLLPEASAQDEHHARRARVLDLAARRSASLSVRFAMLVSVLGVDAVQRLAERWRVPVDVRSLAELVAREGAAVGASIATGAAELVALLERCDAFRKPERFADALLACEIGAQSSHAKTSGNTGHATGVESRIDAFDYPPRARLERALAAAQSVSTADVAAEAQRRGEGGPAVGNAIRQARIEAVAAALD